MKLFCYLQAATLVSAGPAFGNRGERCQNVIDFFKRDRVIRNDSKLMKKMISKSDNFIDVLKQAEASCEGSNARNIADFDDDLDRSVSESNVFDKIEACTERFGNYIDQKVPASECPNAHARVQRVLLRMNGRMRKAAEARTKRVLSAGMRSMNAEDIVKGMSEEEEAAKQAAKEAKRDNKAINAAEVAAKQDEKAEKQGNKAADREVKAAKAEVKAENQAEKAAKQENKAVKQAGKEDKRERKAEKPMKEPKAPKEFKAPKEKKEKKNKIDEAVEADVSAETAE